MDMADEKVTKLDQEEKDAVAAMGRIFDAIPKGKFARVFDDANTTELMLRRGLVGLRLLDGLRGYFLETTGEASPFVKKIDELIPRQ